MDNTILFYTIITLIFLSICIDIIGAGTIYSKKIKELKRFRKIGLISIILGITIYIISLKIQLDNMAIVLAISLFMGIKYVIFLVIIIKNYTLIGNGYIDKKVVIFIGLLIVSGSIGFKEYRFQNTISYGFYVDMDENFYVAMQNYKRIKKFDNTGKYINSIKIKDNKNIESFYVDLNHNIHIIHKKDNKYYDGIFDSNTEKIIKNKKYLKKN